jgi:hypothetical protein
LFISAFDVGEDFLSKPIFFIDDLNGTLISAVFVRRVESTPVGVLTRSINGELSTMGNDPP